MMLGIDVGKWSDYDFAPLEEKCSNFAESKTASTKSSIKRALPPRKSDGRAVRNPSTFTSAHWVTGTTGTYPTKHRAGKVSNPLPQRSCVVSLKTLVETLQAVLERSNERNKRWLLNRKRRARRRSKSKQRTMRNSKQSKP